MLRIGLVGLGKWGTNILKIMEKMDGVVVHHIEEGASSPDVDAVIIATPSRTHAAVAMQYLERGLPTFIEKPLTTSLEDAGALVATAQKSGALLFVGHIYLYNPAFWVLRASLSRIGTITHIQAEGAHNRPRPQESVLWDWLPHHLCMTRELCGLDASSVRAEPIESFKRDDAARCTFTFGDVVLDSIANWAAPERRRIFHVFGSEGDIVFDDSVEKKVLLKTPKGEEYVNYENTPPLTVELQAFIQCIEHGTLDRSHAEESLALVKMIEAAVQALETGREVSIT